MLLVVVDTNVWISALLNSQGAPRAVAQRLAAMEFVPVITEAILNELAGVGRRRRLVERFGLSPAELAELSALIVRRGRMVVDDIPEISVSRDPRDDMFLAAAIAANADYIVTRDDDLKRDPAVAAFLEGRTTEVLSVRQFLERLDGS